MTQDRAAEMMEAVRGADVACAMRIFNEALTAAREEGERRGLEAAALHLEAFPSGEPRVQHIDWMTKVIRAIATHGESK